ncbi:MAG: AAA family ATPase [Gammaproteobacteria bacterium]
MEIRELNLLAFGPFSDRLLDFSSPGGGLHIIYGPNEAGKSSSLRGLKALLFGIDPRTTDNFRYENKDLRIGGTLRSHDGRELAVIRRKGNKNTLLSPDGGQLVDNVLAPFLHGVGAKVFEMLFGIDHEALVRGGQEILEQKGEVGQALFAASMGSAALHAVLEELESEADVLFKPRGSTQVINASLKVYAELQKSIKTQSLSSREWGEARKALERTIKDLEQVQDELVQCKAEHNRLQRIRHALPKITERRELLEQLEALGNVVVLPDDFGKRRQAATLELEKARAMANSATASLGSLQERVGTIAVNREVLALGETIEALHARLAVHRKAMQDCPHLEAQRSQLLTDAEFLLRTVRPELVLADVESLQPVIRKGVRITELGNQRQALMERVSQGGKALRRLGTRLQQALAAREKLAEVAPPEALRRQVVLARKQGDLDELLRSGQSQLESLEQACLDDLSRLGSLWNGTLDDIPGLPLPARESIDRFEQAYADLTRRVQRLEEKQDEYADTVLEAQKQLDEIQHTGAVPAEQDLLDVRAGRDRAWGLLRRQWLEGEVVDAEARALDPERALPEAFEFRLVDADDIADRLRREAEHVQKRARSLATLADAGKRTEEGERQLEACRVEKQQLDSEWVGLWELVAIQPLPPRQMRAWLENMEKLQARIAQLNEQRRLIGDLKTRLELHSQALHQELSALGGDVPATESLEALLVESEAVVGRIEALARQRLTLDTDIQALEQELESARLEQQEANEALETWRGQWLAVVGDLGLGADALPAEVTEMLENIRTLSGKLKDAEDLRIRIECIRTDARAFREDVASVVTRVAPELAELPAEESVTRLKTLLSETGKEDTRRQQLEQQIQDAQERIKVAEATRKTMTERLDALCREAQCKEDSELELAERRSSEFLALRRRIETLEQELRVIGEGVALAALEVEVAAANPDTLPGEIEVLTSRIDEELQPRITELHEAKGKQENELERMDGSDDAAVLADEAQSVLVRIRSNAEQYVRVKLASRILRNEVERYRQQHQGPLLERASEHFTVLTQGSFAGLRANFNEKDEPVLVGVRPNDDRVYVEGMSSGTRDQLYLALRLASLEKYMESAEPMPFIVDDILVHFDDARAQATLGMLAELARRTQVILFTHHARLVEQAKALDAAVPVTVHSL